jgi:hypothetical protein
MKITRKITRKQFAGAVVSQLIKHNISSVLVGGACVSIYTNDRHESKDLDFISPDSVDSIGKALGELGFERNGRYFSHPETDLYVEFPSGPVAIGNTVPLRPEGKLKVNGTTIIMLSPTQCVMDRLAAWFAWNDRRSLIHALWVCDAQPINLAKLKAWAEKEQEPEKFAQFLEEFRKLNRNKKSTRK